MNFDALTRYLDALPDSGIPGCDLIVMQDHKVIYRHFCGEGRPDQPTRGDETYWLYSATKVFTMTAAMQLIEQGKMSLDDPVSKYLPAFADLKVQDGGTVRPARTVMTLQHAMSMQGGLDYDQTSPSIVSCQKQYGRQATTRQLVDAIAGKTLLFDPGTHFKYSLCHDVVAGVVEAVSGMIFSDYLEKNIFKPLGISDMTFHPTAEQQARMAKRYKWDEAQKLHPVPVDANDFMMSDLYESGGGGLMGSVESYILLMDALANGGVGRTGERILSQSSIDEMRTDRMHGDSRKDFDAIGHKKGYSYGLGVRTLVDAESSRSPLGEFGWDGAAGAWAMADPENHLAAFYAQHVLNCTRVYYVNHPAIRDLIYDGLEA